MRRGEEMEETRRRGTSFSYSAVADENHFECGHGDGLGGRIGAYTGKEVRWGEA